MVGEERTYCKERRWHGEERRQKLSLQISGFMGNRGVDLGSRNWMLI
jgi:hypothetical protein